MGERMGKGPTGTAKPKRHLRAPLRTGVCLAAISLALAAPSQAQSVPRACDAQTSDVPASQAPSLEPAAAERVMAAHKQMETDLTALAEGKIPVSFSTNFLSPSQHRLTGMPFNIPVLRVVFETDRFFATGRDNILPAAIPAWRVIADGLIGAPDGSALYVVGHTDERGERAYNFDLGQRRAEAVARAIATRGTVNAQVYRLSFGEDFPCVDKQTQAAYARNRRVEFLFAINPAAARSQIDLDIVRACSDRGDGTEGACSVKIERNIYEVVPDRDAIDEMKRLNEAENAVLDNNELSDAERGRRLVALEEERRRIAVRLVRPRTPVSLTRRTR